MLVSSSAGAPLVARVEAREADRFLVVLPDGSLGWTSGEMPTDRPFNPWTSESLRQNLVNGPFRGFASVTTEHYLVLTEGSLDYANASARLLEELYRGLIDALRSGGIDARAPEFPLVAVIFRDRDSMGAHHPVEADVRAFYEIYSNRIFNYETSPLDERAPDLAALRRPQSLAHEGVHQLLQNVGVQPRAAKWPPWLVEGLAEYFAPATLRPQPVRGRFGSVDPFHMATLIDLRDPFELWTHLEGGPPSGVDGPFSPAWEGPTREMGWIEYIVSREELGPTDYALTWALTHYLAVRRPDRLKAYIQRLGRMGPLEEPSSEEHLEEFRDAFGKDFRSMTVAVDRHLTRLSYEQLPYFAVPIEFTLGPGVVVREAMVSQSQVMIQQWLKQLVMTRGASFRWLPPMAFPSRNLAMEAAEVWKLTSVWPTD